MQKKFLHSMTNRKLLNRFILVCVLVVTKPVFAGDPPIERDFLSLPDSRWIELRKIDWHKTRVILGRKNKKIWSSEYEQEYDHLWDYAYFVKLKSNRLLVDLDQDGFPEVGIATYELGNNMIRDILIFSVKKDRLVFVKKQGPFNLAEDGNVFP